VTKVSAREVFDQIFFALSTNAFRPISALPDRKVCQLNAQVIEALPIRYLLPLASDEGGRLLVMLRAAHKGSLRSAAYSRIVV
jgi:hypothetical protein